MNKTLGSTLITSGTMIGAGMLAMPLTSAGIGFTFTVVLLVLLWILLTYSALLFVEVYQTAEHDAGIGTLAAQYFGRPGRIVATSVLMIFLYALLSAYVTGGGAILASTLPDFATPDLKMKGSILAFTSPSKYLFKQGIEPWKPKAVKKTGLAEINSALSIGMAIKLSILISGIINPSTINKAAIIAINKKRFKASTKLVPIATKIPKKIVNARIEPFSWS